MSLGDRLGERTARQLAAIATNAKHRVSAERVAKLFGVVLDDAIKRYGREALAEDLEDLAVAVFDDNEQLWLGESIARNEVRKSSRKLARRLAGLPDE